MILDTFSGSVAFSLNALFFHTIAGTNGELPFHFRGALQSECVNFLTISSSPAEVKTCSVREDFWSQSDDIPSTLNMIFSV